MTRYPDETRREPGSHPTPGPASSASGPASRPPRRRTDGRAPGATDDGREERRQAEGRQGDETGFAARLVAAARLFLLGAALLAAVGVAGHFLAWPLLTATLGPTLYVFLAHPGSETSRLRAAVLGHAAAVAVALAALAVFGLWAHPAAVVSGHASLRQAGAAGVAVGSTLAVLQLTRAHHAPAAATAVLVATGLARPGRPLFGLLLGLCAVIALGPALARLPLGRGQLRSAEEQQDTG